MWADNEADLDLLGFDYLVDGLVVALTEPRLLPLTIGVLGDWGSGKSSLMRLSARELRAVPLTEGGESSGPEGGTPKESAYLTVEFSPWQHEDYEDVKVALMTAVLDALQTKMPERAEEIGRLRAFVHGLRRWGRRLGRIASNVAPTAAPLALHALAPGADPALGALLASGVSAAGAEAQDALVEPSPTPPESDADSVITPTDIRTFRDAFGELVAAMPGKAIIVFIDDLDRCLPDTVVDTFEAIRLFLNTPKTAYVLALNQNVVEAAIDSRYPELKKGDDAGIGRDYLEKMLQLKIAIPALSAPEAETYANLLFAELHLSPSEFATAVATTRGNRRTNGLSVAFNAGIAGDCLGEVPDELAKDLAWAAEITPILGTSLRGNPRQLKRFLNNLLLKHRSAARRDVHLDLPVLAKLMVLEDQYHTDFQKLFDWEMAAGGKCPELAVAEDKARDAGETQAISPEAKGSKSKKKEAVDGDTLPDAPSDAVDWANKPHIGDWLRVEPSLKQVDLRPYFTYSRDKLSFGVSASRLAPHLQHLLTQVQSDTDALRRSRYPAVADLGSSERAQLIEALLERAQRYPSGPAPIAALELAEANADIVDAVCSALGRIPASNIPPQLGSAAVRRLPKDNGAVATLLDTWEASSNSALKQIVGAARNAAANTGNTGSARGNLSR